MKKTLLFCIASFCLNITIFAAPDISPKILEKAKNASVSISLRIALSAYESSGSGVGTGFIADKKTGLIVTNKHIVGNASIGNYYVTFHTGEQTEAKVLYYDLWQDFAILKVNPNEIPSETTDIPFSKKEPKLNQTVFIVGNNEAQDFSFHHGHLSNLYDINGSMPQHSYIVNLNTAGGSSGSPLLNAKGEAIGLNYGGSKTYAIVLKGDYIGNILQDIKLKRKIQRRHVGIITELYSLDKAVKHRHFPKDKMQEHLQKFPEAHNRVISVQYIISGSPAKEILKAGDIIWKINGKQIGASLYELDHTMDTAPGNEILLTIYRNSERLEKKIPLYNINDNKINKMVDFAGAVFFEADDFTSATTGIPLSTLTVMNVQPGSTFSVIPQYFYYNQKNNYQITPILLGGHHLKTTNDLVKIIPDIIPQKHTIIGFKNYLPYFAPFNRTLISSQSYFTQDISFDALDNNPRILEYNPNELEWQAKNIDLKRNLITNEDTLNKDPNSKPQ